MSVLQLLPFWVAITTATKSPSDTTPQLVPPLTGIFWQNFAMAVGDGHVLLAILNSVIVTGVSTAFVCLLGAAAAYPLARRLTRWNRLLTSLILALIMIPPLSILVPLYSMLTSMHAINTYWGIILVMVAGATSIFYFSLLKLHPHGSDFVGRGRGARRSKHIPKFLPDRPAVAQTGHGNGRDTHRRECLE
ncbi:MAG: hypothetical protein WDM88_02330 [Galbitalea sp.]